ncbi:MAG: hypothetical protein K0R12_452 [Gammaproteobacteria bacterium]|jgi:Ca-activated chloride channel family protein|nr:hypothetical protein [Gammaproteobacteria bacterium]
MSWITEVQAFHFLHPLWLGAAIPVLLLWILIKQSSKLPHAWQAVCEPVLLKALMKEDGKRKSQWRDYFLLLALLSAVLALSSPAWRQSGIPLYQKNLSRVVILDLSTAMYANDIKPDRLTRARYKVRDLLARFQEGQTGMIAFAKEAYVVSPLTEDTRTIAEMIPSLSPDIMPVQGHSISSALQAAQQLLQQSQIEKGSPQDILLITSGQARDADLKAAKALSANGIHLSVLGIGTAEGSPIMLPNQQLAKDDEGNIVLNHLDIMSLKALAKSGEGQLTVFRGDESDIQALLNTGVSGHNFQKTAHKARIQAWRDQGRWFILPLLCIVLCCFRRGVLSEVCAP